MRPPHTRFWPGLETWDFSDLRAPTQQDSDAALADTWNAVGKIRPCCDPHLTYFIVCGPYVKIGAATNVESRLKSMRTGNPYQLEVRAVVVGGRDMENKLHARFMPLHHSGDWFHLRDELAALVDRLAVEAPAVCPISGRRW